MQLSLKYNSILLITFEDQQIIEEVKEKFDFEELEVLTKAEIVGKSVKEIIKLTKSKKYDLLIISNRNSQVNRSKTQLKLLALFSKSTKQLIYFNENENKTYTKITLAIDILPRLILGGVLGLYVLAKAEIYFAIINTVWKRKKVPNEIYGKKIAFLRTDLSGKIIAGGSLSHIKGFASGARKLGFEVEFYSDYPVLDEPVTVIIKPNSLLDFFDEFQLIDYHFRFYREAKRLFKYTQPNLIYQRHSIFNASGIALSKHFKIPIVLEANNSEVWGKKNWSRLVFEKLATKIERIAFENANVIGVVSDVTKEQIIPLGASEEKIVVNLNGVDPKKFSPEIDCSHINSKFNLQDKVVVGFIGTFTKWHGVEILFESAVKVVNKNSSIVFLLIGDGNLKANLVSRTKELRLEQNIFFTGIVPHDEAPQYLSACDILVSPHLGFESNQRFFGSPTKLFEYMAMGKAIIASNLEQIGKVIIDGVNGLKVKPGDVDELTEKILFLANDKSLRKKLGENARKDVIENYTWEMNAERVLKKLNYVLKIPSD